MKVKPTASQRVSTFLGSNNFWYLALGVFVFQATWIAVTTRYPMAFDEQFHFGIIKLYAHHISPFWSGQPVGADQFGAVARDPSYLYQYLMSFPYRVISALSSSMTAQIIALRLINIALLTSALVAFRRVFEQLGVSTKLRNIVLAFFILTPVVPLLGSQINYDNVVVLMTALAFSTFLSFRSALRDQLVWRWGLLTRLVIICLFASLVKYAFLPLAAGLGLAVLFDLKFALQNTVSILLKPSRQQSRLGTICYGLLLIVGLGLFAERYAVNMIRYHTPIPECNQVLSVSECQGYAPWARNYLFDSYDITLKNSQIAKYPFVWIHRALGENVFSITSRFNAQGTVDYYNSTQLLIPNVLAWTVFVAGGLLAIVQWRFIRSQKSFSVLLGVAGFYVLILFTQNLLDYLHLGFPVAIHGRYLLPIMPLLYLAVAYGFRGAIDRLASSGTTSAMYKTLLAASVLVIFAIEGGGFITPIIRSHDDWFWPQSRPAQLANQYVRDALQYIVIR